MSLCKLLPIAWTGYMPNIKAIHQSEWRICQGQGRVYVIESVIHER